MYDRTNYKKSTVQNMEICKGKIIKCIAQQCKKAVFKEIKKIVLRRIYTEE